MTFPIKRILIFIAGLYCMGLGVALSVIASLGTSPISCFPYVVGLHGLQGGCYILNVYDRHGARLFSRKVVR